jgi:hypothetical protein
MSKVRIQRALLVVASVAAVGLAARPAQAQTGLQYFAVTPCRAVDTRSGFGGIVPASTERKFTMKGVCSIPTSAKAVSLNVTVVGPTNDGFLALWPTGGTYPGISTINFLAGEPALANGAIVPVAVTVTPDLSAGYGTATGTGQTQLVLDVTGYFQ